jgi:heat shock protein HtpX
LASALLKISGEMQRVPQQDLRAAEGMSAFFIVSPGVKSAVRTLFMDHPPTEKRVERLQALEAQLQVAGPRAA